MNWVQATAERVLKHEDELREVYDLYSVGVSDVDTTGEFRSEAEHEMWFLSCTLVGVPTQVCRICIIANYRDGDPIRFRTRRHIPSSISRNFRRLHNMIYAEHKWTDIDSTPYTEELSQQFDLRCTGQLGIAVIDAFDEELVATVKSDDIYSVLKESVDHLITSRDLVFEVSSTNDLLYDFETGSWGDSRIMGPNKARVGGLYSTLWRAAINPRESSVGFVSKNKLRARKEWKN